MTRKHFTWLPLTLVVGPLCSSSHTLEPHPVGEHARVHAHTHTLHTELASQPGILNPLSEARDPTSSLMIPSHIRFRCATTGTPILFYFKALLYFFNFYFYLPFRATPVAHRGSRLGVQLELQLPACTTAAATSHLSHVCNLHHSSWQCQILNPLSEARDRTCHLMVLSQICFCCATELQPFLKN